MTLITHVEDDESLYRCIWTENNSGLYTVAEDGRVRFSSMAFADRKCRPSVDRAVLCNHDPEWARKKPSAGVTMVVAHRVRALGPYKNSKVDVEHRPIENDPDAPDNPAHAEIFTEPECSKSDFRKVREALALLASEVGWILAPPE